LRGAGTWLGLLAVVLLAGCGSTGGGSAEVAPPPTAPSTGATTATPTTIATAPAPSASAPLSPRAPLAPPTTGCATPPKGMVCVPAGPAVLGADDQARLERPRRSVEVSTFYLDRLETTNRDYDRCVTAGACQRSRRLPAATDFAAADQPVVGVTWKLADAYCRWAGKRLPTEAEWEKAARGGAQGLLYPWGNEPPSCDRAHTAGCTPKTTLPVGSLPPGAFGVHDLAGNGYEWVNDWSSPCYDGCPGACGEACGGTDPQGPCGGAPYCSTSKMRVLKGGSWFWPASHARASWRRPEHPESGMHRLSLRCASSYAVLATWPPLALSQAPAPPPAPGAPSKEQLAHFGAVVDDDDIFQVPVCEDPGGAAADCREPFSYIASNESEQHLWAPYIANVGGGYVGIGADQSFNFIAAARSRWAWIFDYDPTVVRLHYILRAVILDADSPTAFVAAFTEPQAAKTRRLVGASLDHLPAERAATLELLGRIREPLRELYGRAAGPDKTAGSFGWLRNPQHYGYVRQLHAQGRIAIRKGNLLTDRVMPAIGRSAQALGVPVRVLYLSNADDQWDMTSQYQQNIRDLPFDERSVVLRTVHPRVRSTSGSRWDYLVIAAREEHRRMAQPGWVKSWWYSAIGRRVATQLVTVALPGQTERDGS